MPFSLGRVFGAAAHEAVVHSFIDIACPLPDVARHVVQAVGRCGVDGLKAIVHFSVEEADGAGARAEGTHIFKWITAGVEVGIFAQDFITPREGVFICIAPCFFLFYFGGQAVVGRFGDDYRVVAVDPDSR